MQQYPGTNQERAYMHQYQNQYGQYAPQGQIIQNNPYASQPQAVPRQTYLKGRVVKSNEPSRKHFRLRLVRVSRIQTPTSLAKSLT